MHRQLSGRDSNHFGKGIIQISSVNFPHRGLRGRAAAGLRVSTPGELRPADRCLPRLAVHTYGARIHTHSVCKIARSAPEISRIFLRRAVWTQVSTQNERECRTMDDDRVSHRSTDAHDARAASSFHTGARTSESPPSSGELPTLGFSCSMEKGSKTCVRIAKCESDLLLAQIQLSAGGITTFR